MIKRRFRDLPPRLRAAIITVGVAEVALNVAAQVDITRRPPEAIRGSKLRWRLISMINFFGPIEYFRRGRR